MTPKINDLALRPRFQREIKKPKAFLLDVFEKSQQSPFIVSRVDDHVFLRFNKKNSHFWSPQLHLEIVEKNEESCTIHGLFGPNPTLWTFFMFVHFGVATLFIALGVWLYSNLALQKPYGLQLTAMVMLIVIWFALYFFGRVGRHKGKPQMNALNAFMKSVLEP
ncbi:GTP-binding protein [Arenibacter sp. GZD96]|uniref:hypothetical protein n=1 Tax=Aurantibrevibacter litoralis TaxID=3106030 RepID=UPI002AFFCD58|nr:hypothetical protein [Arenibacter sp. GZD-96]MEA1785805.1 GTP-binding protein [Arenibacter sp. GZD-96]